MGPVSNEVGILAMFQKKHAQSTATVPLARRTVREEYPAFTALRAIGDIGEGLTDIPEVLPLLRTQPATRYAPRHPGRPSIRTLRPSLRKLPTMCALLRGRMATNAMTQLTHSGGQNDR